jgi:hypothetical protein
MIRRQESLRKEEDRDGERERKDWGAKEEKISEERK